jgi:hypothetical protein
MCNINYIVGAGSGGIFNYKARDFLKTKSCPCALNKHHAMKAYWESGGITPLIL